MFDPYSLSNFDLIVTLTNLYNIYVLGILILNLKKSEKSSKMGISIRNRSISHIFLSITVDSSFIDIYLININYRGF